MSSVSSKEIKKEFLKSKMGIAGITILVLLVGISIGTAISIPVETFQQWNNPHKCLLNRHLIDRIGCREEDKSMDSGSEMHFFID